MIDCIVLKGFMLRGYHHLPSNDPKVPCYVSLDLDAYERFKSLGCVESRAAHEARFGAQESIDKALADAAAAAELAREAAEGEAQAAAEAAAREAQAAAEAEARAKADADFEAPRRRSRSRD